MYFIIKEAQKKQTKKKKIETALKHHRSLQTRFYARVKCLRRNGQLCTSIFEKSRIPLRTSVKIYAVVKTVTNKEA
jgi:hypothetical protein